MKRSYSQNCALAHALDVVGERWTLLIVRELLLGPRRYGALLKNLQGMGTNLLASRLKDMEDRGLIEKDGSDYRLTAHGQALESVVQPLVRFGLSLGIEDDAKRLTRPEWDAVALKALYDPEKDSGIDGRYVIEIGDQPLCIEKFGTELRVVPDDNDAAQLRIKMTKPTALELTHGETTLDQAISAGDVKIEGSRREARRLLAAFGLNR
jgi:DNA-binding HxlR family transcriptional regulator